MHLAIITNRSEFFQEVRQFCIRFFPGCRTEHVSAESWDTADLSRILPATVIIRDNKSLVDISAEQAEHGRFSHRYALLKWVRHNVSEKSSSWEDLSRTALILRLQELARTASPEPQIAEEILMSSPHVRMTEYRVPTRCKLIPRIRDRLLRGIRDFQLVTSTVENHFCMALEEALANAFYHGNLELCSSLKEDGTSRFADLAAERERQMPYCDRTITISETAGRFGLWITISDEGPGFDVQAAIRRCMDPEMLLASGRGLLMMQAFANELFFNDLGNQVTLVLYARSENREHSVSASGTMSREPGLVLT